MTEIISIQFYLPYIILINGNFTYIYDDKKVDISITHLHLEMLEKILSGYLNNDYILKALMGISLAKEEKSRHVTVI